MTELLKPSSIDQYSHKPETNDDNKNTLRLNQRGRLARTGALLLLAAGVTAGAANAFHETRVGGDIEPVLLGDTAIDVIGESVNEMATEYGFNPNEVNSIVEEGQEIGNRITPGQQLESTVYRNGLGGLRVETKFADPDNLAHLDD
ncbi:MAG: hypothetical protein WAZ21_04675 [Candidatus Saccharimonadales bacterium]